MTPQTHKFIEVTYRALQGSSVETTTMGVFVGGSQVRQKPLHESEFSADAHHQTGQCDCMLANRLSFVFDTRGSSYNTDTACSASATAMHLASEALAGVASASRPSLRLPATWPRALPEDANGHVRGGAAVSIVLKPLVAARRNGDRIQGTIPGTVLNANGATAAGLMSPSEASLRACVAKAWQSAGLEPRLASYVEVHATSTTVGDRIVGASLDISGGASQSRAKPLIVGSVKSNVGHKEFCAFLVSLIKALHILRRGKTVPQICAQRASKAIEAAGIVCRQCTKIASGEPLGARPWIGITASGLGGSSAHVARGGGRGGGYGTKDTRHRGWHSTSGSEGNPDDREQQLHLFVVSSLTEPATCAALPPARLLRTQTRISRNGVDPRSTGETESLGDVSSGSQYRKDFEKGWATDALG
ncbi:thiolase-like protein [Acaromyces ingoldii]|uniref:Thiolase-like protein n=1 Tax=Acaromyces ingoldii TaxID=215250 RepID=A0A316YBD3_9BASI|nr:thiolase-like protein [Acaromyces ingoldii]PWN86632.1 thiolase-like protein [Acaromyces ingoldii]